MKLLQDHRVNLAAGGIDCVANMQWLCQPCHSEKTKAEAAAGRARAIARRGGLSKRLRDVEEHPMTRLIREREQHLGQGDDSES